MDIKSKTTLGQAVKKVWNINYQIEKETPGTIRYQQVDFNGRPIDASMSTCVSPTLYVRKSAFKGAEPPTRLTVTITGE